MYWVSVKKEITIRLQNDEDWRCLSTLWTHLQGKLDQEQKEFLDKNSCDFQIEEREDFINFQLQILSIWKSIYQLDQEK